MADEKLSSAEIFRIAAAVAQQLIPGVTALSAQNFLSRYKSASLEELSNATEIGIDKLGSFMNQSIPCIQEKADFFLFWNATDVVQWGAVWVDCFKYQTPTPTPAPTAAPMDCNQRDLNALIRSTMLYASCLLLLVLSFCVHKRKSACLNRCRGFPGPVVRGYTLAFGVVANSIVNVIFTDNGALLGTAANNYVEKATSSYPFISVFVKIFLSVYVAVMAYPFFVAQNMRNKLIGSILGLILSFYWIAFELFKMVVLGATCFNQYNDSGLGSQTAFAVMYEIPQYICLILLALKFIVVLYKTIKKRQEKKKLGIVVNWIYEDDWDWKEDYMYIHVKEVLKKHRQKESKIDEESGLPLKKKLRSMLYEIKPGFKYSTRFLVSMFVGMLAVYAVFLIIAATGYFVFVIVLDKIWDSDIAVDIAIMVKLPVQDFRDYGHAIGISFWLGLATSVILYLLVVMNQFTWYRRHVLKLRGGDKTFLPSGIQKKTLDPATLMTASFKYAGFQVGYCIWGYVLSLFVFWIAWMVVVTQIFLPMHRNKMSLLLILLVKQWPNILVGIVMVIIQMLIARCCFIMSPDTLAIDNRRGYHIFSYFMFYFNIFLGLVSCLVRILLGLALGVVFMQRLAKSTLPRAYERRDPGYLSYVSFLMLEHQHSNPVLQCFLRLLLETLEKELKNEYYVDEKSGGRISTQSLIQLDDNIARKAKIAKNVSIRARNRWHLFVTMTMNPSIVRYRVRFMKVKRENTFLIGKLNGMFTLDTFKNGNTLYNDGMDEKEKDNDGISAKVIEVTENNVHEKNNSEDEIRYRYKGDISDDLTV